MCAQTRHRFIYPSERVLGKRVRTHANSKEILPSTRGSEEGGTRDAASRRTVSLTRYRLSYSGPEISHFSTGMKGVLFTAFPKQENMHSFATAKYMCTELRATLSQKYRQYANFSAVLNVIHVQLFRSKEMCYTHDSSVHSKCNCRLNKMLHVVCDRNCLCLSSLYVGCLFNTHFSHHFTYDIIVRVCVCT